MDIGNRLRNIRLKRNLTLAYVGEKLGKTEATVQRYESGNIKNLKIEIIEQLAWLYNVSPAYLMGWEMEEANSFSSKYDFLEIQTASEMQKYIDGNLKEGVQKITIPDVLMEKWQNEKDLFFLKANGNSMDKVFLPGSLLAVKPIQKNQIKNDDILVYSDEHQDISIKRIYIDHEKSEILFNPDSYDRTIRQQITKLSKLEDTVRIYGKVVKYFTETFPN